MTEVIKKEDCGFNYNLYPVTEGKPKGLVVMFLGYGLDLTDWVERFKALKERLKESVLVTVEGPIPATDKDLFIDGKPKGYSWLDFDTKEGVHEVITQARESEFEVVNKASDFVANRMSEHNLSHDNAVLAGYSMGGLMSMQTAFNSKAEYAGVVAMSCALMPNVTFNSKPEVHYAVGKKDPVFTAEHFDENIFKTSALPRKLACLNDEGTARRLKRAGVPHTINKYDARGHGLSKKMWNESVDFIEKKLNAKKPAPSV